jgi:endonuclease YncB( thermonuclease family)
MPSGLLELHGTIDIAQFWPSGDSDADTTKVIVDVGGDAFQFRKNSGSQPHPTHVFENAKVKGRTTKAPITNGKVTIRLQGIDAPELHYEPAPLTPKEKTSLSDARKAAYKAVNHFYRQYLGASSTKALHDFLSHGAGAIAARVFTHVDKPNEVFDTYGRMVADIEVTVGGQKVDINHWLVEKGWVFPTFYSSMNDDEIEAILKLAKTARSAKRPVWKNLAKIVPPFDFDLRQPKKNDLSVLPGDKGPVILPKLFRRYASWSAHKKAKITMQTFQAYLAGGSAGKPDDCFETQDFLENGIHSATHRTFDQFVKTGKTIEFQPDGLVFSEAPSKLIDANNKPIMQF